MNYNEYYFKVPFRWLSLPVKREDLFFLSFIMLSKDFTIKLSNRKLCQLLKVSSSALSRCITRLVKIGYINVSYDNVKYYTNRVITLSNKGFKALSDF